MFVDAHIVTEKTTGEALPSEAVVELDGKFYVLRTTVTKDSGYTFEILEIQPGNSIDGFTEVKNASQFSDSDTFLAKGAFDVLGD